MIEFSKEDLETAVKNAKSVSETVRILNEFSAKSTYSTVKRYINTWGIQTQHFLSQSDRAKLTKRKKMDLNLILTENSTYARTSLKKRLYEEGLKERFCEICGQSEIWCGKKMSLILDHINGSNNDNRLDNLRIVCPNCNATLDTHAGKNKRRKIQNKCACGQLTFNTKYCSRQCFVVFDKTLNSPKLYNRKVLRRPSKKELEDDLRTMPMVNVGKKYGVSDNAVRKWLKYYDKDTKKEI